MICLICGRYVPEGREVCPLCEKGVIKAGGVDIKDKKAEGGENNARMD